MHTDRIGSKTTIIVVLFALGLVFLFLHSIQPAQATVSGATITVNSSADPSEAGKCTLRDAIENANSDTGGHADCVAGSGADTIIFSSSISTITLNSILPTIQGILTVQGDQIAGKNQVISGNDSSGIFSVGPGATLSLEQMTLTHGNSHSGSAIAANAGSGGSTVVISDSLLTRNQAVYDGGAVSIASGTLTVTHSTFSFNQTTYSAGWGGAISIAGGITHIGDNSYFWENHSIYGGAVNADSNAVLHLADSRLESNTANRGGALYLFSVNLQMVNCQLLDNGATIDGGAILAAGGTATISSSIFDNNGITDAPGSGGAIFSFSSNRLIIDHSTFHDNQADGSGGAIASNSTLTITNTAFNTNWVNDANGVGGAVYLTYDESTLAKARLESSTFYGNIAYKGGALENEAAITQIINSTFNANKATDYGSAIDLYTNAGAITITHSTIAGNSGPYAIYMYDFTKLTLRHSLISNNLGANCSLAIVDGGYNLQNGGTDSDSCGSTIQIGDPQLAPLADNGGPTLTMLFQNAVAMNRIPGDAGCGIGVFNDQRGVTRPRGTKCDIGAVENNMYLYLPAVSKSP